MTGRTCQVLYAKYNSVRRPEYRITTEICEDGKETFVRKRAGEPAARPHLENIYKNGLSLGDYYDGIQIIPAAPDEGVMRFPYIQGRTLEEQIDMERFEKERFIAQVNEKLDRMFAIQGRYAVPFRSTPEFEAMFGEAEIGEGVPALDPANIDSLLSNFVENDTGLYCIDCEWVCHFPVPVAFVKYRALLYLYVSRAHYLLNGISMEEMLGWFGLSTDECAVFWRMDDRFQQYVHGDNRQYIYTQHYRKNVQSVLSMEMEKLKMYLELQKQGQELVEREQERQKLIKQIEDLNDENRQLKTDLQTITNAFSWRVTKPARVMMDGIKQIVKKNE